MKSIDRRLRSLGPAFLEGLRRGIEKESLRVRSDGSLATTPHPPGLGSPLTHPHVTTDFSESQLELITGVHASVETCLEQLTRIHQVVYRQIGNDVLWCVSMPCDLPEEDAIPIARYGRSNLGRMKSVYRQGLAHRYGRRMQMISGIHYNFSLPDAAWAALKVDANAGYFRLIRNFRRHSWLLLYHIGASPAVCASFVAGRPHALQPLGADTLHLPHATSLRMGRLGYQSDAQAGLAVSYNSLESYGASVEEGLTTPFRRYEDIGIGEGADYRQLSTTLLQIENEFYGTIRPKRRTRPGERPLHAVRERGVEYVEVRLIDLDPFSAIGITAATLRFFDVFLLQCLLSESALDTEVEIASNARNQHRVSERGREPGLTLERRGVAVPLVEWGLELLEACRPVAAALDRDDSAAHTQAVESAVAALGDPDSVPSARVLEDMERSHGGSHARFALAHSLENAAAIKATHLPAEVELEHARTAEKSLAKQREVEAGDDLPFESYREMYLSPERLRP